MKQKVANTHFLQQLEKPVYSASLAVFRMVFGVMILFSTVRFWSKGWIEQLYIKPGFFFSYYGFEWVKPLGQNTYLLFIICGVSALFFALGLFYRIAAVLLFISFTYIELMDKTNYLNHYYFVSLVLFLMMWLPAHVNFSIDSIRKPKLTRRYIPLWTVGSIRLMMAIVYIYAGLAKLNSDWLAEAMPLRLWLPANNDMPVIGPLFNHLWVAYFFSWFGALYDLFIAFFLLNKQTRPYAYATVVIFHLMTAALFPIGVFPYVMIVSALVFFESEEADKFVQMMKELWRFRHVADNETKYTFAPRFRKPVSILFVTFFTIQLVMPWRYLLNKGELFWTEEGYRFSWRVMLMEKMGYAQFVVVDAVSGSRVEINNNEFLTRNQEKMMATQPDFILQYAKLLYTHYSKQGLNEPEVYGTVYVALNGRRSRPYIDETVNLAKQTDTWKHKNWIQDFNGNIYGL